MTERTFVADLCLLLSRVARRRACAQIGAMDTPRCQHPEPHPEPEGLRDRIREAGLRVTETRLAVLEALQHADRPLSHAEVMGLLAEDRDWDRATVFRNLADLAKASLLQRYDLGDHVWRYEVAGAPKAGSPADSHDNAHPHFMCTECGDVQCLPGVELRLQGTGEAPQAVRARSVEVQLRGLCDTCA